MKTGDVIKMKIMRGDKVIRKDISVGYQRAPGYTLEVFKQQSE
jgi:hypothetical protein